METARPPLSGAPAGHGGRESEEEARLSSREERDWRAESAVWGALGCRDHANRCLGLEERRLPHCPEMWTPDFAAFVTFEENPNKSKEIHSFFDWFLIKIRHSQTPVVGRKVLF